MSRARSSTQWQRILTASSFPDGIDFYLQALLDLGRDEQAASILPAVRRMEPVSVISGPVADRAEAALALKRGDQAEARRLFEKAALRFEQLSVPFEVARSREQLAALVDEPRRSELRAQALRTYEALGARPFVERVRSAFDGGQN